MGHARTWEQFLLLAPVVTCLILTFGVLWGVLAACLVSIAYPLVKRRFELRNGQFVFLIFTSATLFTVGVLLPAVDGYPTLRNRLYGAHVAAWPRTGELAMKVHRNLLDPSIVLAALVTVAIVCVLS